MQDRKGAQLLLPQLDVHSERLQTVYADGGYSGQLEDIISYFYEWHLQIIRKLPKQKGFVVLPKRWVVERTFAWGSKHRRLSKDYEFEPQSSEAMLRWALIGRMARWLTKPCT